MEGAVRGLVLVQPQGPAVALHPDHPVHCLHAPTVQFHCTQPVHFRHRNLPRYRIPVPPGLVFLASYRRPLRQQRPVAPMPLCRTAERQQLRTFISTTVYFQTSITYYQYARRYFPEDKVHIRLPQIISYRLFTLCHTDAVSNKDHMCV